MRLAALVAEADMSSASIEWSLPVQPPNVTAFRATLVDDDGNVVKTEETKGATTSWHLESILAPDTEYTVSVVAVNEHGSSVPSNNLTFTTVDSCTCAPSSPKHAPNAFCSDTKARRRAAASAQSLALDRGGRARRALAMVGR